jgi:hypothetical protein
MFENRVGHVRPKPAVLEHFIWAGRIATPPHTALEMPTGRAAGWDIGLRRREPPVSYGRRRVECPTWWWPSHFDDLYRCIGSGDAVADAGDGLDYVGGAEPAAQPADSTDPEDAHGMALAAEVPHIVHADRQRGPATYRRIEGRPTEDSQSAGRSRVSTTQSVHIVGEFRAEGYSGPWTSPLPVGHVFGRRGGSWSGH